MSMACYREREERRPSSGAVLALVDGEAAELRFPEGTRKQSRREIYGLN